MRVFGFIAALGIMAVQFLLGIFALTLVAWAIIQLTEWLEGLG